MLAEEVAQEFEDYWDANEEFSCDGKGQAEFIASIGKGPGQQEKGGKQGGKSKGKGKLHKGLGFQPERGEQRRFGGYCKCCWRIGHKEAQCWLQARAHKKQSTTGPPAKRHS